jgi:hypothetical protein
MYIKTKAKYNLLGKVFNLLGLVKVNVVNTVVEDDGTETVLTPFSL